MLILMEKTIAFWHGLEHNRIVEMREEQKMKTLILAILALVALSGCGKDPLSFTAEENKVVFAPTCPSLTNSTEGKVNMTLLWSVSPLQNAGCCAYAKVDPAQLGDLLYSLSGCTITQVGTSFAVDCWDITSNSNQPTGTDPANCKWNP